ncbi:prephenate dehydrogenase [Paenibacillus mucilaginosus]|uniref:Prephenate dehydrogenase n=3 Tax=Paenibacillus mucilaginosus TaxID=61624 RepID=H6NAI2_9BACL|nr:prephenate dehydrogenase [Paenibacillus mucilaginosus]AEI41359.1 prephenate dehydrogenase [Paenibacillus mucilaginosus KNP414]AFC29907.1 prephenate dehydrogenase [Paenibacillus mucilaginosus 3016]AFH62093.1 prephenate dehydrogenase [Paenibacillus mucilaginosus K02]MCG7211221.1 prephenate dehydrogenase [Paenibacillus mucilaginosus]WDM30385.1 prephenate dehydrogenase [Paenibacillus mucilaginosus]
MTKIAIYGVGLIGGSLALCFKGKPGLTVVGHSGNPASVAKYLKRGVVDHATTSFEEAAADADFIFLCVPVGNLNEYLEKLASLPLKPGCIITDVGSTKASVSAFAAQLRLSGACFIGGHPMAGKEKSGVEAASSLLFENAFYVLTPDHDTPAEAYERLAVLLQHTKAQLVKVEAGLHDEIVGAISHLPHIIAVALVNQIAKYNEANPLYRDLAAGGFRDITRIASSDPIIWRDILINNKKVVLQLLQDWNEEILSFIRLLEAEDGEGIEREFQLANTFRSELPERRKGVIHSFYDIYIEVPDHPGIIGQITTLLGSHRVNLSNIQIIESREDVPGVLRLSFREEEQMDKALELLKEDYAVHV